MFQSGNTSLFCFVFFNASQYILLIRHNVIAHTLDISKAHKQNPEKNNINR